MEVNVVVEGASDVQAALAVVTASGHSVGKTVAKGGKTRLDPLIPKYIEAAKRTPWVIFRDTDNECPVQLKGRLLRSIATPSTQFHLRLAHSMIEAWLLADRDGFSKFFQVSKAKITSTPEELSHAKREVLMLCAGSRSRSIRNGMVAGANNQTGPLYVPLINEYARDHWSVEAASEHSTSLRRAIERISSI